MNQTNSLSFIDAKEDDLKIMLDIYNYYIMKSTVTFDWNTITLEEFEKRIFINHMKYKTFTVYLKGEMIGFCFLTQFRDKVAYNNTVELGLYLKPQCTGNGYGKEIVKYMENIAILKKFDTIIASISGENMASIKLFKKLEYEQCSHYKAIAMKFGRKIDLIDFQKII